MTSIEQILSGVQALVSDYSTFAIVWHVLFYSLIVALLMKWTPSYRTFGFLLCVPLLSVSVFAWISGNPFNGSTFALAAILVFLFSLKAAKERIQKSPAVFFLTGIFMVAFGLVYPHFIHPDTYLGYLYASPAGLIPCPTLSIVIGFALIFGGSGSKQISNTLVIFGLFYGVFGVMKLGVKIDVFLAFGALMLLVKNLKLLQQPERKITSQAG